MNVFHFYVKTFRKSLAFYHLYIFLDFFSNQIQRFSDVSKQFRNPIFRIPEGGFSNCMTSLWRVRHVTATKIKIFGSFTHHISFIFIASTLFEIHMGALSQPPPGLRTKKKPRQNRVNLKFARVLSPPRIVRINGRKMVLYHYF